MVGQLEQLGCDPGLADMGGDLHHRQVGPGSQASPSRRFGPTNRSSPMNRSSPGRHVSPDRRFGPGPAGSPGSVGEVSKVGEVVNGRLRQQAGQSLPGAGRHPVHDHHARPGGHERCEVNERLGHQQPQRSYRSQDVAPEPGGARQRDHRAGPSGPSTPTARSDRRTRGTDLLLMSPGRGEGAG